MDVDRTLTRPVAVQVGWRAIASRPCPYVLSDTAALAEQSLIQCISSCHVQAPPLRAVYD